MSKVFNNHGAKAGCIYRIALENFVTYKQVVLFPSQSLNLIIGPNGTGKSTFVSAIILGLCGKTSVIGRAKKISEYVRRGCENASIEIELYREHGKRNVIITRSFDLNDVSTWSIDHKTVREKQVQELIASLNIQVDNLCQLLPQDRVQDFSKMNAQELLRSTLSAVGGQQSVAQLDELIDIRSKQRVMSTKQENNTQLLQEQIRLNERLKITLDSMTERKNIEKQIEICEKKKLWLEYQELREKVVEFNNDKIEATKLITIHKNKMEPLQDVINKEQIGIDKLEEKKLSMNREIHTLKDNVKETINAVREQMYLLKDIEASLKEKMEHKQNREKELCEAKLKLNKLITDKMALVESVGDDSQVKMALAELQKPIMKTNSAIEMMKKQKLEIQHHLDNIILPQIRLYQNKIRSLEDIDVKRLDVLRGYREDCYNAVMWLRKNKEMFQKPVYEPMMLEINFTDPKFARYLESVVPSRDLVAFTFESNQDMNLFLQKVRIEGGLKRVNAICSTGPLNVRRGNISQLSYLGFYTYLIDTITGPDAIINYLCKKYAVHRIPIGNKSENVPANITLFFTENHRFNIRVSAYSGVKSSSIIEIRPARLLANTIDVDQVNNCNKELSSQQKTAQSHNVKLQELDNKLSNLEINLNELYTKRKRINDGVEKVRTICAQIRVQQKKVQDVENDPNLDIEKEKHLCRSKQRDSVIRMCRCHEKLKDTMRNLQEKIINMEIVKIQLDFSRNAIVQLNAELRAAKNELKRVQATLENIENRLQCAKTKAKEKLTEAKKSCNNKLPQDPEFPYKDDFEQLPCDFNSLSEHCFSLQIKIDCMDKGDEQIFKEYEERKQRIAKLRSDAISSRDMYLQLELRMNEIKAIWLPPLESLLRDIDRSFGEMFAILGCAGEIKLDKAGADEDYDKYGVCIMVRFRASEPLQQLTRHAQSGGERALTTALYLMALQRLTTVPFRCVDEINQGMDAINERKMFQLLVKATTECDNAQYFLLTPKLLTNLEYNEKITVHTIMNGNHIMNYRKWKFDMFLENAQNYRLPA